jgi:hypothetical protein
MQNSFDPRRRSWRRMADQLLCPPPKEPANPPFCLTDQPFCPPFLTLNVASSDRADRSRTREFADEFLAGTLE